MMLAESEPFIDFKRTRRRILGEMNLTPLIDILFILIIFFMLTTSFMRVESLELVMPSEASKAPVASSTVHIFVYANGTLSVGKRRIVPAELGETLSRIVAKDPATRIMLFTADGVTTQQLVGIMDRVSLFGGSSLFVRKWENAPAEATKPAPVVLQIPSGEADIRELYGNF